MHLSNLVRSACNNYLKKKRKKKGFSIHLNRIVNILLNFSCSYVTEVKLYKFIMINIPFFIRNKMNQSLHSF